MDNFEAHILVVDDDDGIRNLVKEYLNQNNFLVTTANSAEDAQDKINIIKFDLIVLDIMMPKKSGLELLEENKQFKINDTEKKILEKMINSPGQTFSREDIAKIINLEKERSIDVIITRLRKKIEKDSKNPRYLQTKRGEGYVLWIE